MTAFGVGLPLVIPLVHVLVLPLATCFTTVMRLKFRGTLLRWRAIRTMVWLDRLVLI